jgi:transcriptional regulator
MYLPKSFAEPDLARLHEAIRASGLASLVTAEPDGLDASHVPMLLDADTGPQGTLYGHLARGNPQGQGRAGRALAIFLGPDAYISPGWYETKRETGKVVPTWNYVAIHVAGPIRFFDDAERLRDLVTRLTERHERGQPQPWAVADAPRAFIDAQLKGIIGFEIAIEKLEGKWKMSQNRTAADRRGVVEGLAAESGEDAREVGRIVAERMRAEGLDTP